MHELISTILSQRTSERNEALAYSRMWERFGSWEAVRLDDDHRRAVYLAEGLGHAFCSLTDPSTVPLPQSEVNVPLTK